MREVEGVFLSLGVTHPSSDLTYGQALGSRPQRGGRSWDRGLGLREGGLGDSPAGAEEVGRPPHPGVLHFPRKKCQVGDSGQRRGQAWGAQGRGASLAGRTQGASRGAGCAVDAVESGRRVTWRGAQGARVSGRGDHQAGQWGRRGHGRTRVGGGGAGGEGGDSGNSSWRGRGTGMQAWRGPGAGRGRRGHGGAGDRCRGGAAGGGGAVPPATWGPVSRPLGPRGASSARPRPPGLLLLMETPCFGEPGSFKLPPVHGPLGPRRTAQQATDCGPQVSTPAAGFLVNVREWAAGNPSGPRRGRCDVGRMWLRAPLPIRTRRFLPPLARRRMAQGSSGKSLQGLQQSDPERAHIVRNAGWGRGAWPLRRGKSTADHAWDLGGGGGGPGRRQGRWLHPSGIWGHRPLHPRVRLCVLRPVCRMQNIQGREFQPGRSRNV